MTYREHMREAKRAYLEALARECSTMIEAALASGVRRSSLHRMLATAGVPTPYQRRAAKRSKAKVRLSWNVPRC